MLGTKAIQGHALGTGNTLQNSKEAQRKKSTDIEAIILQLIEDLEEPKNKIIPREEKADGSEHAIG